ncbi:hypothetical protein U3A55_13120 [Salarchaeum sp. III]|uniref:hypothetical protein n=1 Tax=Salarchaeum sp. III TaxID=3107927 RepID=UPI002EDB7A74
MSGSSQRSLAELVRADEHPDACPNGDTRCEGEADLRAGDLCCWYSYLVMLPGGRVQSRRVRPRRRRVSWAV